MPNPPTSPRAPRERPPRTAAPRKSRLPWILGGAVLAGGLVVGLVLFLQHQQEERAQRENDEYAKPAAQLDATALATEWKAQSEAFDKRWKGQVMAVTGEVLRKDSIESAQLNGIQRIVFLKGNDAVEIKCTFDPARMADADAIQKGERVTIVGRYVGDDNVGALVLRSSRRRMAAAGTGGG